MDGASDTDNTATPPVPAEALAKAKHPMEALLKQKSEYLPFLKPGDIVEGTLIEKRGSKAFVDLGNRGTGIVYGREYFAAEDAIKGLEPGAALTAKVVESENEGGYVELSLREAGREKNWHDMRRRMESREPLVLKITDANRGGLILEYLGIQGFLPASQLSQEHYPRVEGGEKEKIFEELKKFVGQSFTVTVLDLNPVEDKLIFSERSQEAEAVRQKLTAYHAGDVIDGAVSGIVSFGAFVRFGDGLEGLVHISEIDWQLIQNPADVLKVGEKVRAKILGIEGDRVSLSLKALKDDPWATVEEKYQKGALVVGTVVKFNPFGAFVKLDDVIQGLAHISEFGTEAQMQEILQLGATREFRILAVDAKEHRLALGLPDQPSSPELQRDEQAGLPAAHYGDIASPAAGEAATPSGEAA